MLVKHISKCRICGSSDLTSIMSLNEQFIATFTPKNNEPISLEEKYPLELIRCDVSKDPKNCGLVQLRHSVPTNCLYKRYFYRSGINMTMTENLKNIVDSALTKIKLEDHDLVLDIGCNDGTLLKNYQEMNVDAFGFDPAENMYEFSKESGAKIIIDFFNYDSYLKNIGTKKAKIITSVAMFYDLEEPKLFVDNISKILHNDGVWIIELSYLPMMMKQNAFDTIVHEHLEYYHLDVLEKLFELYDLKVVDAYLNDINGASIRLFVKHNNQFSDLQSQNRIQKIRDFEKQLKLDTDVPYVEFLTRCNSLKNQTVSFIKNEKLKGKKIYAYGASTKGNTLLQFYNLNNLDIEKVADRNPDKWGRETIGTKIKIISEEDARNDEPDYFLILPWHFLDEFLIRESDYLQKGGKFIVPLPEFKILTKFDLM